ncbi:hypothetical protein GC207_12450 [bacterium]|nr:hypothetical protein [bacterium]
MKTSNYFALPFAVAMLMASSGCVNLNPQPDPTRFYVLNDSDNENAAAKECSRTVLVGPVRLAGSLDQPAIVERLNATEVRFHDLHRWAEPLIQGIPRILISQLSARLPDRCVLAFQRATPGADSIQIELEVDRFEITPDNHANLAVRWRFLKPPPSQSEPSVGAATFSTTFAPGTDRIAAGVASLSKTVDQLADRLAAELQKSDGRK